MGEEDPEALEGDTGLHRKQRQGVVILKNVSAKHTKANLQWFPLGAEGPTSSLISEGSAVPTP